MNDRIAHAIERLYAALLWLYPPPLRIAHGREMRQCARTQIRHQGWIAVARLGADLLTSLPVEWWRARPARPHGGLMKGLGRDIHYAVRVFWRSPGFTLAAVLTLALGIGANTAIFSLADATLLRPLKVSRIDQLYATNWSVSYPDYKAFAARGDLFDGVVGASGGRVNVVADGDAVLVDAGFVSGNYFGVLGVPPAAGRVFGPSDDVPNGPLVGVLSHRWWASHFGRDTGVIGRVVRVNGQAVTIVGVAGEGFRGLRPSDTTAIYFPLTATPRVRTGFFTRPDMLEIVGMQWLTATFRLKPGVEPGAAAPVLDSVYRHIHATEDDSDRDEGFVLTPLRTRALGGRADSVSRFVVLLGVVVVLALLIGCANLANLLLSRASVRRREIGVRLAIGAGRVRVARQLLVESLVLAIAGGAAGLLAASGLLNALGRFELPGGMAIDALDLRINGLALAFTALVSCGTGVLFGVAPAWRAARLDVLGSLRSESRSTTSRSRLRATLVAVQVALSLVLLAGTGLFLRSLVRALDAPLGFRVDGVATASVNLGAARYTTARAAAFYDEALARVHRLPGVTAAAWTAVVPTQGARVFSATIDGYRPHPKEDVYFYNSAVSPDYFRAAGTRLLRGRAFTDADRPGAPLVGIVNETAVKMYWNGRDPIGGRASGGEDKWITIVGVAEDARVTSLDEKPVPYIYLPFAQDGVAYRSIDPAHLLVRTDGDEQALLGPVAEQLRAIDRDAPVYDVSTFAWRVRDLVMPQQMGTTLFACFSVLALALAAIGIYGVAAYVAVLRTRELGIRIALGAARTDIRRLVLRQGFMPAVAGLAAGIALTLVAGRFAEAFLYHVSPRDPVTLGVTAVVLGTIAGVAAWIPARRASRLDPVRALREE
ncbi:MAG TPA: ABC transporter permease [Vicinamibacterales bacterium]|nr:ABC transporter permease [Vicinamibacterales bacterium]